MHRPNPVSGRPRLATFVLVLALPSAALADDFNWTLDAATSQVTTTITATTSVGTFSDSELSNLSGTFGGFLRLPSFDFRQVHLTRADIGFTNNPNFFLGPGGFLGGVSITTSGIGFAIPGPNNLGFAGPGPVAVDLAGNFNQTGNGAEGRGTLTYTGTGLFAGAVGSGTENLVDVSPFDFDVAGNVAQVGNQVRLTVPISFDETIDLNGTPVRAQVNGTLRANATTTANGWDVDGGGDFADPANYVAGGGAANVPGATGGPFDTAVFGSVVTADRTVTIPAGAPARLRRLIVDAGVAGRTYTFAGDGGITLASPAGTAATSLEVLSGRAVFAGRGVDLARDTTIHVAADARLRIEGFLFGQTAGFTKVGPGVAEVAQAFVRDVVVSGGAVAQIPGGASLSRVRSLMVAEGTFFDVNDGALVVDAGTAPTLSLTSNPVLAQIKRAADAGFANVGITSSAAAANPGFGLGYGTRASTGLTSLNGTVTSATALIVRYTRFGDADLDLAVGFADLVRLAQNYNGPGLWPQGDFNYDGVVGFADLVRLAQNYNTSALSAAELDALPGDLAADFALARSLVPEPTTLLGVAAGVGMVARRRRPQ